MHVLNLAYYAVEEPEERAVFLDLIAGAAIDTTRVPADFDCGPYLIIWWGETGYLSIRTNAAGDSMRFSLSVLDGPDPEGAMVAPELQQAIWERLGWTLYEIEGMTGITKVEVRNVEDRGFVGTDPEVLEAFESALRDIGRDCPTKCPFWNPMRLEAGGEIIYGALSADGCPTMVLAPSCRELAVAWGRSEREYRDVLLSRATEYALSWEARGLIDRMCRKHGVDTGPGIE